MAVDVLRRPATPGTGSAVEEPTAAAVDEPEAPPVADEPDAPTPEEPDPLPAADEPEAPAVDEPEAFEAVEPATPVPPAAAGAAAGIDSNGLPTIFSTCPCAAIEGVGGGGAVGAEHPVPSCQLAARSTASSPEISCWEE